MFGLAPLDSLKTSQNKAYESFSFDSENLEQTKALFNPEVDDNYNPLAIVPYSGVITNADYRQFWQAPVPEYVDRHPQSMHEEESMLYGIYAANQKVKRDAAVRLILSTNSFSDH